MQNEHSANAGSAANPGGSEAKSEPETGPLTAAPNGENRAPGASGASPTRSDSREALNGRGTFHPAHSNHPVQDSACRIDLADAPRVTAGGMPLYDEAMAPHVVSGSVKEGTLSIGPAKTPEPPEPPIRTEKTPLSKLPRCLVCREFVGSTFKVVDIHLGVVNPRGVQHVAGLALAHRLPLQLAEIFSAEPDPVNITDDPRVDSRGFFCMECYALSDMPEVEEMMHRRAGEKS